MDLFYFPLFDKRVKKLNTVVTKPYILTISNIDTRKNIQNLVSAFNLLKQNTNIPHRLIIVGKPGYGYKDIIQFISKSPFKKEIILTGYVNNKEKNYLLSKASVFIYIPFYEGLGIPILEAAHFKIPIISSGVPAVQEILKENVVEVDPKNINVVFNSLKKIIIHGYPKENIRKCFLLIEKRKSKINTEQQMKKMLRFLG